MAGAALLTLLLAAASQPPQEESAVRAADEAFWRGFNACDSAAMDRFFSEDVEFYHDLTGLTSGRPAVVETLHRGPCGTPGRRVRREPVQGSVRFDPIPGYGAIMSGEHRFLTSEDGGPERATGQARFAHVWRFGEGGWRMHRVLSYAHGAALYVPPEAAAVPAELMSRYAGRYRGTNVGEIVVSAQGSGLRVVAGPMTLTLRPASETEFFAVERDLRFRFVAEGGRPAARLVVLENGAEVESAVRAD